MREEARKFKFYFTVGNILIFLAIYLVVRFLLFIFRHNSVMRVVTIIGGIVAFGYLCWEIYKATKGIQWRYLCIGCKWNNDSVDTGDYSFFPDVGNLLDGYSKILRLKSSFNNAYSNIYEEQLEVARGLYKRHYTICKEVYNDYSMREVYRQECANLSREMLDIAKKLSKLKKFMTRLDSSVIKHSDLTKIDDILESIEEMS